MARTGNCSTTISREHYISRAILERFENRRLSGAPWLAQGQSQMLGSNALTAKILCERHNNALSPLDAKAAHAFDQLQQAFSYITKRSLARQTKHFLIDGDALERWAIKTALGFYHAGVAAESRGRLKDVYALHAGPLLAALTGGPFGYPRGIYFHMERPGPVDNGRIAFGPLMLEAEGVFAAMSFHLAGASFHLALQPEAATHLAREGYRPWAVDYVGAERNARIILSWADDRFSRRCARYIYFKDPDRRRSPS